MTVLTTEAVRLTVDGVALGGSAAADLAEVIVERWPSSPACLTLVFIANSNRLPAIGSTVTCATGSSPLFDGTVTGRTSTWDHRQGHGATVAVRAYDRLDELRSRRRTMAHPDTDPVEIIRRLAGEHGLEVDDRSDRSWSSRTHHQYGETDLALIRRLLTPAALSVNVIGDRLVIHGGDHREGDGDGDGVGDGAIELSAAELSSLSIDERADDDLRPSVAAWSPDAATATGAGPDDGSRHAGHRLSPDDADTLRQGLERLGRWHQVVATGTARGDHRIGPGTVLVLRTAPERSHRLVATTVTHRIAADTGYTTTFSTEPMIEPPVPPPATFTLGRVVDLDDPQARSRVRVALVAFDGIETDWLPVVGLGGGADRGVVAVPDLDDLALIVGPLDDPAAGVVVGGIPAGSALAGDPTEGGESRRIVARLPGGARLILDPDAVELDDGRGSSLRFSRDLVRLHSAVDLELAAPGRGLVLTADTIDFNRS